MSQGFCKECYYLNITEEEQNKIKNQLKGKYYPDHICLKHDMKLHHMEYGVNYHPEIPKCDKCLLAYGYFYSRKLKNSFGKPAAVFVCTAKWDYNDKKREFGMRLAYSPLY